MGVGEQTPGTGKTEPGLPLGLRVLGPCGYISGTIWAMAPSATPNLRPPHSAQILRADGGADVVECIIWEEREKGGCGISVCQTPRHLETRDPEPREC